MTPDLGREHMMEPHPPLTLGPPEAAECDRCGEPAERRARFWKPFIGGIEPDDDLGLDDEPGDPESDDFDLCDTCYLLWAKAADMTPAQNYEFWRCYRDGGDE